MGKRQHQKDKMYLTYTEWTELYGGKRVTTGQPEFRRLPFDHCAISLMPYEVPYCDRSGNIFDLQAIINFIKKFKTSPITGKPMDAKSLIKLNFTRDDKGKLMCPVTRKNLTQHSHIVVIASTGNVFSFDAVEKLNLKPKNYRDLITDEVFSKDDIITLQDPNNLQKFNLEKFHHIKNKITVEEINEELKDKDNLKTINRETREVLKELAEEYKPPTEPITPIKPQDPDADKFNAAHYSTGLVAAGLTSTVMAPELTVKAAVLHEDVVRYERVKKKGYVRLVTNVGPLNLELDCDIAPKTCENFIKHCQSGYYNGTLFHRSIRHFMAQGGDPTNKGNGGESIWGGTFKDEIVSYLKHAGRGILSMANNGPDTNRSQFFITYRSCRHLDGKHTIFGKVVGGIETLSKMERIEVDNKDKPIEDIKILVAHVFVDPYQEADDKLAAEREEELERISTENKEKSKSLFTQTVFKAGVGKYIDPNVLKPKPEEASEKEVPAKKKKNAGYKFNNFNNW